MVVQRKARLPEEEGFIEEPATMATGGDTEEVKKMQVACLEGNSRCKHREVGARRV